MRLPSQFFGLDENNLYKGYVEWGFMSTTSKKDVAMLYTGVAVGKKLPHCFNSLPQLLTMELILVAFPSTRMKKNFYGTLAA